MDRNPNTVGFNKIYILQSLTGSSRKTGVAIEQTIKYCNLSRTVPVLCKLINITSKDHLFSVISEVTSLSAAGKMIPYLHFEMHADKEGLEVGRDSVMWHELKNLLTTLNKVTRNNLFISMASCFGAYLFRIIKISEPCPFFGYIGPDIEIRQDVVEANFTEYFTTLLAENSFDAAIESLERSLADVPNAPTYTYLSCYGLYELKKEEFQAGIKSSTQRNKYIDEQITFFRETYPDSDLTVNNIRHNYKTGITSGVLDELIETWRKMFLHEV